MLYSFVLFYRFYILVLAYGICLCLTYFTNIKPYICAVANSKISFLLCMYTRNVNHINEWHFYVYLCVCIHTICIMNIYMYIYSHTYIVVFSDVNWNLKNIYLTNQEKQILSCFCFSHSVVSDPFETPWTVACSTGRLLCPWDFPDKYTAVGGPFLLQRIFLTQGLNLCLLDCRWILYHWAYIP